MTLHYVPIINLAPYFSEDPDGKAAVAKAVNQACRDIGFLVITEHQIPGELIDRVSCLTRQFFDLPLAEKRKVDRPSPEMVRGYSAVAEETFPILWRKVRRGISRSLSPSGRAMCRMKIIITMPRPARTSHRMSGLRKTCCPDSRRLIRPISMP